MAIFKRSEWGEWAKQWGFTHSPQRSRWTKDEWMAGPARGYLVKIGWAGDYGAELYVIIRFPKQGDPSRIEEGLRRHPQLTRALPGWKRKRAAGLTVTDSTLMWRRTFSWARPKSAAIQRWVEELLAALPSVVQPFDGRCEECHSTGVSQHVLIDGIPAYVCGGCQERLVQDAAMAERQYERLEANYALGTLYGCAAAAVGGGGWALLAISTNRIYALVAIGIAWLVAWAYVKGAGKIDRLGQALSATLTMAGVVIGEVLYYAYMVHATHPELPFRVEIGWQVFLHALKAQPEKELAPFLFGLFGVWYTFRLLRGPRFKPTIERSDSPQPSAR